MSRQPYIRPVSKTTWYMRQGRYKRYMLREVTCLLVAVYCFLAIWGLASLAAGPQQWGAYLESQQNIFMVVFHAAALTFYLVYMTFDWFKLAPKALPVQFGEKKIPDGVIVMAHYFAWALVSLLVLWLAGVI